MRVIGLVVVLTCILLLAPLGAPAQPPAMPVVGVLNMQTPDSDIVQLAAIRQGLKEAGFVEGQNVAFDLRFAEGIVQRFRTNGDGVCQGIRPSQQVAPSETLDSSRAS